MSKLLDNLNEIEMQKASFIIPKNLKKNVSALGVTGTLEYLDTSDATAQAKDIKEGQTAYINDQKVTGNLQYEPSDFSLNGITGDPVSTELKTSDNNKYIQLKYKRSGADTIVGGSANITANLQQETMAVAANITADKIKKGAEVLGVIGTYEGSDDVKLFDTVEQMQQDTTAQEGDLAIVYGKGYKPLTEGSIARYVKFPETITFPSPLSPEAGYFAMRPVDSSITDRQLSIDIGTNYFMVQFMSNNNGFWMVDYTTTDNIHYTCSRVLSNPYDLSCPFQFDGEWNDLFSYILDTQVDWFDGLYRCVKLSNSNTITWELADTQLDAIDEYVYKKDYYGKYGASAGTIATTISNEFADVSANLYIDLVKAYDNLEPVVLHDGDKVSANYRVIPTKLDGTPLLDTGNLTSFSRVFEPAVYNLRVIPALNISGTNSLSMMCFPLRMLTDIAVADTSHIKYMDSMFYSCYSLTNIPNMNTQNVTSMSGMFINCAAMIDVPNFNTVNVTSMSSMFYSCYAVKNIPNFNMSNVTYINSMMSSCTKLENAPMIDAPKVTNAYGVFWACYQLKNVPCFNLPNATNMTNMFAYCNNLTDESLNNILGMCSKSLNASNKKLGNLGLSQNLLNRCVNLSNYQNAVSTGWSV